MEVKCTFEATQLTKVFHRFVVPQDILEAILLDLREGESFFRRKQLVYVLSHRTYAAEKSKCSLNPMSKGSTDAEARTEPIHLEPRAAWGRDVIMTFCFGHNHEF